jgi:hypothetical protein
MTKKRYQKLMRAFVTRMYLYTKERGTDESGFSNEALRNIYRDGAPEGLTRSEWFDRVARACKPMFNDLGMGDIKELK